MFRDLVEQTRAIAEIVKKHSESHIIGAAVQ
jgi:hypothetical protein